MSSTDPTPLSETGEREQAAVEAVVPIIDEIAAIAADGKLDERDCLADAKHIVSEVREALDKPAGGERTAFAAQRDTGTTADRASLDAPAQDAHPPADSALSGEQSHEGLRLRVYPERVEGGVQCWRTCRTGREDGIVEVAPVSELASEREKREAAGRRIQEIARRIARHRDDLDRRALGDGDQVKRDRDQIDNDLYNSTIGPCGVCPLDARESERHDGASREARQTAIAKARKTVADGIVVRAAQPVQVDDDRPERDLTDVIQGAIEISSHRGSRPLARSIVRALQHAGLAPPGVPDGGRLTTDALRGGDPGLLDAVVLAIDWDDDAEVMASKMLTAAADYLDQDAPSGGRDREAQIRLVDEEIGDWAATHSLDFGLTPEHGRDLAAAVVDALAGTGVPETAGGEGAGAPAPERDGRTPGAAPLAGTSAQPLPPEPSAEDGERPDPSFVVSTDYFEGQPEELPEVEDITAMVKHGLGDEVAFTVTVEPLLETLAAYRVDASSTGLCSDRIEALGDGPPLNCELRAGHDGDHQAGRTRWGTISPPSDAGLLAVLRDLPLDVVAKIDRRAWEIRAAQPGKVLGYDETRSYITATAEALSEHHEVEGGVAEADCFVARLERKIARLRRLTGEEKD